MEQSEYLYDEWETDKLLHVFGKILAVLLIFCVVVAGGLPGRIYRGMEELPLDGKVTGICGAASAFGIGDTSVRDHLKMLSLLREKERENASAILVREKDGKDERADVSEIREAEAAEERNNASSAEMTIPVKDEAAGPVEVIPPESVEKENMPTTVIDPDNNYQDAIEVIPDTGNETDIPYESVQDPSDETEDETGISKDEDKAAGENGTAGGFLVDDSGMICGIADAQAVAVDGVLALPSEGCSGIASGAFADAPEGIIEVHIPANITNIQQGAFLGLKEVLWYEVPSTTAGYSSEDGVLFSENGSCLLAFPSARIGAYAVPSGVERFAVDAFSESSLSKIDMRSAEVTDTGNVPDSIEILR